MNPDPVAPVDLDSPFRFDHVLDFLTNVALCVAVVVGVTGAALIYWRLRSPEIYEERVATPARLLRWRLWAHISWQRLCKRCGLSASEQITRRDKEGRHVTSTRWFHPKLSGARVSRTSLYLTVRTRMGQTIDDLERAVPAIRDAAGAHSARSVVISPGTLRIELVMREQLSTVGNATPPTAVATTRVTLGRSESGSAWTLPVSGRHTLTVGCSGAGKGSVFWGIAGGLGPAVAAGVVRLVGIDLKYGIEVAAGSALFTKVATTEADAVETLAALEKLMNKRGTRMAGRAREHTPTVSAPLVVLLIDELAGMTAYMSDAALRKEAAASLSRILTKGRALGIVVAAFLQDPRKEVLPMRGLFTQTIALRLRSRDEVTMVLGDGMADAAPAHRISPDRPGTGYVIAEDGQVTKVRSDYWSDVQIRSTAKQYGRAHTMGGKRDE
ncbi:cell division protein FtsK [Mycobacterium hodleri]|uniref:FtsK/SpoIIIE domain-containing protein n=1 Tax=Mycolicibacterium hodleri TaxID=49897 RepID=UPI0021F26275|nr:FtsK/SpoIIIE domain-containing protein [Mycolicibacterium hodleri]MCV7134812.1 cell division protein FtsK [Mycolicibacterium hodleri]